MPFECLFDLELFCHFLPQFCLMSLLLLFPFLFFLLLSYILRLLFLQLGQQFVLHNFPHLNLEHGLLFSRKLLQLLFLPLDNLG